MSCTIVLLKTAKGWLWNLACSYLRRPNNRGHAGDIKPLQQAADSCKATYDVHVVDLR